MMRRGEGTCVVNGALLWGATAALLACVVGVPANADVASDQAAAMIVFPKIVVDTSGLTPRGPVDTLIRVSNTSDRPITMWCFLVNANGHCSSSGEICNPYVRAADSGCSVLDHCVADWQESDFVVHITARQPVAWLASRGAAFCEQSPDPNLPCLPLSEQGRPGPNGQTNDGSLILPVPEDPFIGEMKCIAVNDVDNLVPVERNDLKGEVEIVRSREDFIDVAAYNAIGIPAITGTNNGDDTLVLGGGICVGGSKAQSPCADDSQCVGGLCAAGVCTGGPNAESPCAGDAACAPGGRCSAGVCLGGSAAQAPCSDDSACPGGACALRKEYSACPNILILDHFFDGATDPVSEEPITTDLTLVPCSEDFLTQTLTSTTVQFLVFNEFEQRVSTSRAVSCFQEFNISDIQGSKDRSIFSAAVQGTLTGQTRLRGVADQHQTHGHALLGVAEEFREGGGTAAFNLHFQGRRPQSDFIYLP